jgi:TonB family protein
MISRVTIIAAVMLAATAVWGLTGPAGAAEPAPTLIGGSENGPHWVRRPSGDEIYSAYPELAARMGLSGRAVLRCYAQPDGTLTKCSVEREDPRGHEFGKSALKLVPYFQLGGGELPSRPPFPIVLIPVRFEAPQLPSPPTAPRAAPATK